MLHVIVPGKQPFLVTSPAEAHVTRSFRKAGSTKALFGKVVFWLDFKFLTFRCSGAFF